MYLILSVEIWQFLRSVKYCNSSKIAKLTSWEHLKTGWSHRNSELQFPTFTFVFRFAYHMYALSPRISDLKQSCFCFVLFLCVCVCVFIDVKDTYFEILVKLNNLETLSYTWSPRKVTLSCGASPCRPLWGTN